MKINEDQSTEFKREYTKDIVKTVISFANTVGGNLYIGISDDGDVVGIDDVDETILRVTNIIRDAIKPDVTLFVNCTFEYIDDKKIIKISVQKGTMAPYYLTAKGLRPEGVYVRQGASSVPANEALIRKMIIETDGESYESRRSIRQDLTFDEAKIVFNNMGVEFGDNQFRSLKLINSEGLYTNLGFLISDQCSHTIKFAYYEGRSKKIFKDRKEFTGSLLKQMDDALKHIEMYNKLHGEIKGIYRVDEKDYPTETIREALLNALVHRAYSFSSSTLISLFEDRIEYVSVGGLLPDITVEDLLLGVSASRNETLANLFYRLDLIEAYGTGIPKMMESYKEYPKPPLIETSQNAFKITLFNINHKNDANFDKNRKGQSLIKEASYPDFALGGTAGFSNDEYEDVILGLLKTNSHIARVDVEDYLNVSQATAVRILKRMVSNNQIKAIGGGRSTKYIRRL